MKKALAILKLFDCQRIASKILNQKTAELLASYTGIHEIYYGKIYSSLHTRRSNWGTNLGMNRQDKLHPLVECHNSNNGLVRGNKHNLKQINENPNTDSRIKPRAKRGNARSISYLGLVNPIPIDDTNQMAHEKIEQLNQALFEKTEETSRLKEEISHKH
jgi:hypothetical protein